MFPSRAAASPLLLGAAFAVVAFGAKGGTELGRTTTVEILVLLAGGLTIAGAFLWSRRGRLDGALTVLLFFVLVAVTALSVVWSVAPSLSFVEAGRALTYLAALGAAVAAGRLAPRGSPVLVQGLLFGCTLIVGYGLLSRVFPGTLAENELSPRVGQPYGYWNALASSAAMLVPAALWLGTRPAERALVRALAYPALGLAVVAILLTQSRGALVAALIGAALWVAIVPLRLRSLPVLVAPVLGGVTVAAWALSRDPFTSFQPLGQKEAVAGEFGLFLLLMVALLYGAGLAVDYVGEHRPLPMKWQRRVGVAALAVTCAIPVVGLGSVAVSDRGLGGTIGDRFDELTSETEAPPRGPARLTSTSSSRSGYWRQAGDVFSDRPALGMGAGTFGISRLRYRKDEFVARHAHGYVAQALADTGLLGLAATLAVLVAWLVAALRNLGLVPRWRRRDGPPPRRDWHPERIALVSLFLVVVVFGLQSAIDWTWFVPALAVMALAAAGFLVGRGRVPRPAEEEAPPPTAGEPRWQRQVGGRTIAIPPPAGLRALCAGAVVLATLLSVWAVWTPQRSESASDRALELTEEGDPQSALQEAESAHDIDPVSPRPLLVKATVESAMGRDRAALRTLESAALEFPNDPQTWLRLASFQLRRLERPSDALETVRAVLYLDPLSKAGGQVYLDARIKQREEAAKAEEARVERERARARKRS